MSDRFFFFSSLVGSREGAYGRVSKRALGDRLEER